MRLTGATRIMKQREAELFADIAHSEIGQRRKYTHEPYICHPKRVAYLVKLVGGTDEMIAAAFLHDVAEDVGTKISRFNLAAIERSFGKPIMTLVQWLTNVSLGQSENREERKKMDREHLANAPREAKTIKLADLIDNCSTIAEYDPGFAKVYLPEKRLMMPALGLGDGNLWRIADNLLRRHGY